MHNTGLKLYAGTVQDYIADHEGPDWGVLIIDNKLRTTLITENAVAKTTLQNVYSLNGIHIRYLLVVVNLEIEDWMPIKVAALTTGQGCWMPFTLKETTTHA